MRALSLTRPWPFAFTECNKRLENRSWLPTKATLPSGTTFALHAAMSWDEGDREYIQQLSNVYVPNKQESPHSQIFAVATYVRHYTNEDHDNGLLEKTLPDQAKWFIGPYAWYVENLLVLKTPVQCKGAQGLWLVPETVNEQIQKQMEEQNGNRTHHSSDRVEQHLGDRLFD